MTAILPIMEKQDVWLVVAQNVKRLMQDRGIKSQSALSRVAKTDQKTVGHILKPGRLRTSPRVDTLEKVAAAFDIEVWQLFMSDMPLELFKNKTLAKLYDNYKNSNQEGRQEIIRVSEKEVRYSQLRQIK